MALLVDKVVVHDAFRLLCCLVVSFYREGDEQKIGGRSIQQRARSIVLSALTISNLVALSVFHLLQCSSAA